MFILLYAPVSNNGLVTLPKIARDYLELISGEDAMKLTPVTGNCILIAKYKQDEEAGLAKPIRLTKKGQFTISRKYRNWLQLDEDTEVYFSIQNDKLMMSKAAKLKVCLVCQMTGSIHGIECCICEGSGNIRTHSPGILTEIFVAFKNARKYGMVYSLINQEQLPDGSIELRGLPKLTVSSLTKPYKYVLAIQEHYEKCIKEEFFKLNFQVDEWEGGMYRAIEI